MARRALVWMLPALALLACQEDTPKEQDSDEPAAEDSGSPEPCETWFLDEDGDGYGDPDSAFESCDPPEGAVQETGDSDDSDSSVFPGATELCDGVRSDSADTDWADDAGLATFFPDEGEPWAAEGEDALLIDVSGELRLCSGDFELVVEVVADDVRIVGAGATESALIGRADSRVVTADSVDGLSLSGLTLRGGEAPDCADGGSGCGGGLAVFNSTVSLTDTNIGGSSAERGGGVFVGNGSVLTVDGGLIQLNEASQGGGLFLRSSAELSLTGTTVKSNEAASSGGGIHTETAMLSLPGAVLDGNTAEVGGGLFAAGAALSLEEVSVTSNTASSGGGLAVSGGSLELHDATVSSNRGAWGGGINLGGGAALVLVDSLVDRNTATLLGGGLYAVDSTVTLERATLSGNRARDMSGGGVWADDSPLTVTDSTLEDNEAASRGGGIAIEIGAAHTSALAMTGSTVTGNTALRGGGIAFFPELDHLNLPFGVEISDSSVSGNQATSEGAGLYVDGAISLALSTVTFAENEGGHGGGVYMDYGTAATLQSCTFLDNTGATGGGISMSHGASAAVTGGLFEGNSATEGGGAIRLISLSVFSGESMDFVDNSPDDIQVDDIHGSWTESHTLGPDADFSL